MMRCEISVNRELFSDIASSVGRADADSWCSRKKVRLSVDVLRTYGQLRSCQHSMMISVHTLLVPYFSFFFVVVPDVQTYLILMLHVYQYIYIAILLISYFTMP